MWMRRSAEDRFRVFQARIRQGPHMQPNLTVLDYATLRPAPLFPTSRPQPIFRCQKKVYPSKRDALTARNAAFQRRHHRPDYLRAYPCSVCQGWHLTHLAPLD